MFFLIVRRERIEKNRPRGSHQLPRGQLSRGLFSTDYKQYKKKNGTVRSLVMITSVSLMSGSSHDVVFRINFSIFFRFFSAVILQNRSIVEQLHPFLFSTIKTFLLFESVRGQHTLKNSTSDIFRNSADEAESRGLFTAQRLANLF